MDTGSEYARELIRKDQDCVTLRALILEGAASAPADPADDTYFDRLHARIRQRRTGCQN